MGYFDKIAETSFKEGDNGETIYFPNGIFGKGRLIKDPNQKTKLFKFHKRINKYLIPLVILYGIPLGLVGENLLKGIVPILIIGVIIFIRQRFLMRGLQIYDKKLSFKEATSSVAKAYHPTLIILMLISGVILILLALSLPLVIEKPIDEILSLVLIPLLTGILSFGVGLYLYKIKKI